MQLKVKVIGDSQLRYITEGDLRYRGEISISYRSGSGIGFAERVLAEISRNRHTESPPDIIVLFTGGNDLDAHYAEICRLVARFVMFIQQAQSMNIQVMVMTQWPRPGARYGAINYTTNKEYFESKLFRNLPENGWLWKWDRSLPVYSTDFLKRDGIHCRPKYLKKVARYLLSAILAAVRKRNRN